MNNKRQAVLDAAVSIVDESGLSSLSVTEAALRAGVSRPTVYKHFPTRDDLVAAVKHEATRTDNARVVAWLTLAGV
jgi:AcrR family transcriptional regulator